MSPLTAQGKPTQKLSSTHGPQPGSRCQQAGSVLVFICGHSLPHLCWEIVETLDMMNEAVQMYSDDKLSNFVSITFSCTVFAAASRVVNLADHDNVL